MASSSDQKNEKKPPKKGKKTDKVNLDEDIKPGTSSFHDQFIPLAARDSEWVGLSFYNPHFKNQQDYDDYEEQELQAIGSETSEMVPIYLMFPNLKEMKPQGIPSTESTTNVTKMLVGQKADFSHIKCSKKVQLDNTLQAVIEVPQEEKDPESVSSFTPGDRSNPLIFEHRSESDHYDTVYDFDEDLRPKHKRKRKKSTDLGSIGPSKSSDSGVLIIPKKRTLKLKDDVVRVKNILKKEEGSSEENFGDDEQEDEKCNANKIEKGGCKK